MKLKKLSQLAIASAAGLAAATLLSSCAIVTIDYVYVAETGTGGTGQIQSFYADSQTGALRAGSPASIASGGSTPVALAATADYQNLYVVNQGSNNVAHFTIGGNGVLAAADTVTTSANPVYIAVNTPGTYLYVISGPSPAVLTEYALSGGKIGAVTAQVTLSLSGFATDKIAPTGVTVLPNNGAVYVTAYDQSAYNPGGTTTSSANPGWVYGYAVGSGGALSAVTGSPWKAGVKPSAIAVDPTSSFVYITDYASAQLIGYTVQSGNQLYFLINGPFAAGTQPSSVVVDPRGKYIFVANSLAATVGGYVINLSNGTPSATVNVTGSQTNGTDTDPVSVTVDAALGRFVYTANQVGNSVTGFRMNPDTGAVTTNISSPYPTGPGPTAIITVPNGNHSVQSVTP